MLARTARPATCALLVALAGCAEEPSFQLGWRISTDPVVTDPNDAPTLNSVKQCSEVGIEKVRLEVRGTADPEGTLPRFVHDYACFHDSFVDDAPIDGPTLAPGEYELELIGLRRNGNEWLCPGEDDEGNPIEVGCVRDQSTLTIREGELPELGFLLQAPQQCDDGVDNDRDGQVDASDPACQLGELFESYDAGLTIFQLELEILTNPLIEPRHVHIEEFAFEIDGEPLDTVKPDAGIGRIWPWRFHLLDARLDAGSHTLSMVALGSDGSELTQAQTHGFEVDAETGAFEPYTFKLGSADFLAPIEDPLATTWAMGDTLAAAPCGAGLSAIDDMRVRVHQGNTPLALGVDDLVIYPNAPLVGASVEADDWLAFACDNAGRLNSTAALTWTDTGYSIEIEGRIAGVTCFASGIVPLRPGSFSPVGVVVSPVLDDQGVPPNGCPN